MSYPCCIQEVEALVEWCEWGKELPRQDTQHCHTEYAKSATSKKCADLSEQELYTRRSSRQHQAYGANAVLFPDDDTGQGNNQNTSYGQYGLHYYIERDRQTQLCSDDIVYLRWSTLPPEQQEQQKVEQEDAYTTIGTDDAKRMVEAGVRIIDVRQPEEWNQGHIAQAQLVPINGIYSFGKALKDLQFVHATTGAEVELHHRLADNPHLLAIEFDALWDGREEARVGDTAVATLGRRRRSIDLPTGLDAWVSSLLLRGRSA